MTDLVVIESPNKKGIFEKHWPNKDVVVCATLGYLLVTRQELDPLEISIDLEDTRHVRIEKTLDYLLFELERHKGAVYLCTDDDSEGEVIAQDFATLATQNGYGDRTAYRVRCRGLDADSIRAAVLESETKQMCLKDIHDCYPPAAAGHARRVMDRLFAGTFGSPQAPVGRVIAGFLDAVNKGVEPVSTMSPPHMGDILMDPALMDIGVVNVSQSLQTLYERGLMSYPRTAGRTLNEHEQRTLAALSRRAGTQAPHYSDLESDEPHHALHPLGDAQHMRQVVDRTLFQAHDLNPTERVENAVYAKLLGIPQRPPAPHEIPDKNLVERFVVGVLLKAGLGRPSSWPAFAEKMADWNVLNPDGTLTMKGVRLSQAQPVFMTQEMARTIEQKLLQGGVFSDEVLRSILKDFPDEALEQMVEKITQDTKDSQSRKNTKKDTVQPVALVETPNNGATAAEKDELKPKKPKEHVRKRLRLD